MSVKCAKAKFVSQQLYQLCKTLNSHGLIHKRGLLILVLTWLKSHPWDADFMKIICCLQGAHKLFCTNGLISYKNSQSQYCRTRQMFSAVLVSCQVQVKKRKKNPSASLFLSDYQSSITVIMKSNHSWLLINCQNWYSASCFIMRSVV